MLNFKFTFVFYLFFYISSFAQNNIENQYRFNCEPAFYQLINNQLHQLSVKYNGKICWKPALPSFKRRLTALGYNNVDGFIYSLDSLSHKLIRIYNSGSVHSLGVPIHEKNGDKLNVQLVFGEIANNVFVAYSPKQKLLYWIDIKTNSFTTSPALPDTEMVNLAYSEADNLFWSVGENSSLYSISPQSKNVLREKPVRGLPSGKSNAAGNLWVSKDNRFFASRKKGVYLYELNPETEVPYNFKSKLPLTYGDATSCSEAFPPAFIEEDILEFYADVYNDGSAMLKWTGVHEFNNELFHVEESPDNINWKTISVKPSAGKNLNQNPYGAQFRLKGEETKYFRLRKTDNLNAESYSKTVGMNLSENIHFLLSPQLLLRNNGLVLLVSDFKNQNLIIKIKDVSGRMHYWKSRQVLSDEISLSCNVADLPAGYYYMEIISEESVFYEWFYVM
jgi:hypothetical protein